MSYKILYKTQGWGSLHTKQGCSTIEVSGKGDPRMYTGEFKCEKCGQRKIDHTCFKVDGWISLCDWCCKEKHDQVKKSDKLEFDPLFSW